MSYNPITIADWFIQKGIEEEQFLTQAKVQKLVYFAHAWNLAFYNEPLCDESFEAWAYGPVIPSLYQTLKGFGREEIKRPIEPNYDPNVIDENTRDLLEEVRKRYNQYSASELIGLTHRRDDAWAQVYEAGYLNTPISDDLIKSCYKQKLINV